ncbi:DUF1292 domain-containing protein [bacterium]|nr:DUF1292 domain-containing protein [bacterium]
MAEEDQIIETVDEDGKVVKFELIDVVEVDEQEYALLLPLEEEDNDEVVLMRLTKDGEEYLFETIEDDAEFEKVETYVKNMDYEEYYGDDEEEDEE